MKRRTTSAEDVARIFIERKQDPPWLREEFVDEVVGRGLFAKDEIAKGQFIVQYCGDLLSAEKGYAREQSGCWSAYRYFFKDGQQDYCIDATDEPVSGPRLGRLANHADFKSELNAKMKIIHYNNLPALCLFALKDICLGQEIRYDYGIKVPWKKKKHDKVSEPLSSDKLASVKKSEKVCLTQADCSQMENVCAGHNYREHEELVDMDKDQEQDQIPSLEEQLKQDALTDGDIVREQSTCETLQDHPERHQEVYCPDTTSQSASEASGIGKCQETECETELSILRHCGEVFETNQSDHPTDDDVRNEIFTEEAASVQDVEPPTYENDEVTDCLTRIKGVACLNSGFEDNRSDTSKCEEVCLTQADCSKMENVCAGHNYREHEELVDMDKDQDQDQIPSLEEQLKQDALIDGDIVREQSTCETLQDHPERHQEVYCPDTTSQSASEASGIGKCQETECETELSILRHCGEVFETNQSDHPTDDDVRNEIFTEEAASVQDVEPPTYENDEVTDCLTRIKGVACLNSGFEDNRSDTSKCEEVCLTQADCSKMENVCAGHNYREHEELVDMDKDQDQDQIPSLEEQLKQDALIDGDIVREQSTCETLQDHPERHQEVYCPDTTSQSASEASGIGKCQETECETELSILRHCGEVFETNQSDHPTDDDVRNEIFTEEAAWVPHVLSQSEDGGDETLSQSEDGGDETVGYDCNSSDCVVEDSASDSEVFEVVPDLLNFLERGNKGVACKNARCANEDRNVEIDGIIGTALDVQDTVHSWNRGQLDCGAVKVQRKQRDTSTFVRHGNENATYSHARYANQGGNVETVEVIGTVRSSQRGQWDCRANNMQQQLSLGHRRTVNRSSDPDAETVSIRPMKQASGLRNRNKFPCNFCPKMVFEYARHVTTCHASKKKVAAILKKPKRERNRDFQLLREAAVRRHNICILEQGYGELIVSRRNVLGLKADNYLPCPACSMLLSPKLLWRHYKVCACRKPHDERSHVKKRSNVLRQARIMMEEGLTSEVKGRSFTLDVLGTLRRDEVSSTVKKDELILLFGQSQYKRLGHYRATEIAQRMRLLGRLLLAINSKKRLTLMECINGKHFDDVLHAVESLCCASTDATGRNTFLKPSLGTKLGHSLIKCAKLKKREAIKHGNKKWEAQADRFIALHTSDWADNISAKALMTLKLNRLKGPETLPGSNDLVKLKDHIDTTLKMSIITLKKRFTYSVYRNLLEYTLAALILFNRRRGGEASKLLLAAYEQRRDWNATSNQEIIGSLTDVERQLIQRIDMVHIPGKKTRVVPMLILPSVSKAMHILVKTRRMHNLSLQNQYFFATDSVDGHLYQYKVLKKVASEAQLEQPNLVRCTKLRKHLATMAQIVNLTNGEQEWLSSHLGHELHIDKDFYRTNDAVLEISRISRLLMAAHTGKLAQYAGRQLADIHVEDGYLENDESEDDGKSQEKQHVRGRRSREDDSSGNESESSEGDEERVGDGQAQKTQRVRGRMSREDDSSGNESESSEGEEERVDDDKSRQKQRVRGRMNMTQNKIVDGKKRCLSAVSRSSIESEEEAEDDGRSQKKRRLRDHMIMTQNGKKRRSKSETSMKATPVIPVTLSCENKESEDDGKSRKKLRVRVSRSNSEESESEEEDKQRARGRVASKSGDLQQLGKARKPAGVRIKWTPQEIKILKAAFQRFTKPPDGEAIREIVDQHPILSRRTLPQIKSRAWHLIKTGR